MGIFDIFWFFIIISALQPAVKQRMLESARQRLIAKIEHKRNSRVIVLIHRQETMSLLGFPIFKYIDIDDSEQVIRAIHMTDPEVPIDLVLHTPGGLVLASLQIAKAIKKHRGKVTVFVPHYAMSGGTLIALAADEIVMGEHAVLGPVDPQLGEYPAASLVKLLKEKPTQAISDKMLILADMAEKSIAQVKNAVEDLLPDSYSPREKKRIAELLSCGTWTHDFPITCDVAKEIGLKVNTDIPREFYQLMSLYPQPVRKMPSVEFIPDRRGRERSFIP